MTTEMARFVPDARQIDREQQEAAARARSRLCYRDGCEAPARPVSVFCSAACAAAWEARTA